MKEAHHCSWLNLRDKPFVLEVNTNSKADLGKHTDSTWVNIPLGEGSPLDSARWRLPKAGEWSSFRSLGEGS